MARLKLLTICFVLLFAFQLRAQTDWVKWDAQTVSYELTKTQHHEYSIDKSGFGMTLISFGRNVYYFFISDLDGDNCPFNPTCSQFLVQSIKETNIFVGPLMFADRFTRDLNFIKGRDHYQILPNGRFFDPAYNYTLNSKKIKF